jgi:hypothetical protein
MACDEVSAFGRADHSRPRAKKRGAIETNRMPLCWRHVAMNLRRMPSSQLHRMPTFIACHETLTISQLHRIRFCAKSGMRRRCDEVGVCSERKSERVQRTYTLLRCIDIVPSSVRTSHLPITLPHPHSGAVKYHRPFRVCGVLGTSPNETTRLT